MLNLLRVENICKQYPNGTIALSNVSFNVMESEIVYILGSSGAGKTTLLKCINMLENISSGNILFMNQTSHRLSKKMIRDRRSKIGMIFQQNSLVPQLTALQNVLHGCLGHHRFAQRMLGYSTRFEINEATRLLCEVGLSNNIYTKVEELSIGQQQRIGIARALIQEPKLLLCDEPISSLDPNNSLIILNMIRNMAHVKKIACLISMHQFELAQKYPSRAIGLKDGSLFWDGNIENITKEKFDALY